jgi:hypothetical protein
MRSFTVLLRSGQTVKVQGEWLCYEKPKPGEDDQAVVEVRTWENNEGILVGVFELSQIHGIFAEEADVVAE